MGSLCIAVTDRQLSGLCKQTSDFTNSLFVCITLLLSIDRSNVPVNESVLCDIQLLSLFPGTESVRDNNPEVAR